MYKSTFLRKNIYLKTSIIWIVILVECLTLSILGYSIYSFTKKRIRLEVENKIKGISLTAAKLIQTNDLLTIKNIEDQYKSEYLRVHEILQKIKESHPDIKYIYTMKKMNNGRIIFTVDAEPTDSENFSPPGDVYNVEVPALNQAFTENSGSYVNLDFIQDKWGVWLSAFAPVVDMQGRNIGVVGVDLEASKILNEENHLFKIIGICSVISILLGILISIRFAKKIVRPLYKLSQDVNQIQNFNFEETARIHTRIYEFKELARSIAAMRLGLRSFKKYVPAEVVLDLLRNKQEAFLSVEKKEITVMFTDIIDFTTISEKISLDDLLVILSEYFAAVTEVISRNRGTVDKFIGDSIMAFWGAPHENDNHAYDACRTALEIQLVLHNLNKKLVDRNLPALNTRVGISTGICTVGNIGHKDRFNYTAVGDTVNLASRVELLNKNYSTDILMTESTYEIVKDFYDCIKIDHVPIKGKKEIIDVYQLLNVKDSMPSFRQRD